MPDERLCRCPACNPIHHARAGGHHRKSLPDCKMCGNTRRVTVDVAERYMTGHNGVSTHSPTGKAPNTAQPDVPRPPKSNDRDDWRSR